MHHTIISAAQLLSTRSAGWVLLDCRFCLEAPQQGQQAFDAGRIPGAHYLSLAYQLSGQQTGHNGRHPLPDGQQLAIRLGKLGIAPDTQVIAYDNGDGIYAARAWWLLRWLGHENVAILDGGLPAYLRAGGSTDVKETQPQARRFVLRASRMHSADLPEIISNLSTPDYLVVDARSPDRFIGQNETLDPVGGHIPNAVNHFFRNNLDRDGCFKSAEILRESWLALLGAEIEPWQVIHQCGSGVSACINLLAMEIAGLSGSRLYPGSWSEWCADPDRPVVRD